MAGINNYEVRISFYEKQHKTLKKSLVELNDFIYSKDIAKYNNVGVQVRELTEQSLFRVESHLKQLNKDYTEQKRLEAKDADK